LSDLLDIGQAYVPEAAVNMPQLFTGRMLNWAVTATAGTGFLLMGYGMLWFGFLTELQLILNDQTRVS
jgi:hypothetical protein